MNPVPDRRQHLAYGAGKVLPLVLPGIPFAMALGLLMTSNGIGGFAGWSTGWIILSGAAHLAFIDLFVSGASAIVILTAVLLINARHAMYSAALKDRYRDAPLWFRVLGSYLMIDQVFAVFDAEPYEPDVDIRVWRYFGAGAAVVSLWMVSLAVGVAVGDAIPDSWQLSFSVPVLFGGLMVLSIRNRPGVLAAIVGASTALLASDLPSGSDILLAILSGMAAGAWAEGRTVDEARS